jgi:hypothetical protein
MEFAELFPGEAPIPADDERQRVAHGEHGRGAGRWRKPELPGFPKVPQFERDGSGASQRTRGAGRYGDNRRATTFDQRKQPAEFFGFAAVGECQDDVSLPQAPEIAVNRLGRMKEMRPRPGGRQRGSQLSADQAGLAHAGDDDRAGAFPDESNRIAEPEVEPFRDSGKFVRDVP